MTKIHNTKYNIPATNKLLVVLGPTSSGKSDIAIKLAKKFNGEIISADSRQIFRGMDVGTGKVTGKFFPVIPSDPALAGESRDPVAKKMVFFSRGIPHYMINIISPRTEYNVAKFKKQSEKIIEDILQRGKVPIICGGTGFWIKAIVDNVNFPEVKPDLKLRKKLEKYSAERLFSMLKKLDPDRAKTIDAKNKVRLIRAIEICKSIKKVPPLIRHSDLSRLGGRVEESTRESNSLSFASGHRSLDCISTNRRDSARDDKINYTSLQIGLELSREKLYDNIEKRVLSRFKQGMIEEVEKLHAQGLSWKKIQSFGLAYFCIPLYLQEKISKQELFEKVIQAEKNYAKRQMTWFNRDKRIQWLKNYSDIEKVANNFLK